MTLSVTVERNGKVLLPVAVRRALNIRESDSDLILHLDETAQTVTLETRAHAIQRIRTRLAKYIPAGTMLSEELLADRRQESTIG